MSSVSIQREEKDKNHFDAIVVGSGISGGWAAKELCEKGLKVLLLDRGSPVVHPHYPTAMMDPWEFPHYNHLTEKDKKDYAIQCRHYSIREDNKHFYIRDIENPYEEIKRFDWIRGNTLGGRSLLWGRQTYRWSDLEFGANQKDGYGVDWPIRYADLEPWYDYVEKFIGVSGSREGIPQLPDGIFQPPFEMNEVEKYFKNKIESRYPDRKVIMGRVANLTQALSGRGPCMARNLCHRGCPYGAYFSTNSSTLPLAMATGNLTVRPYSLVNQALYHEEKGTVEGVEITDTQTHKKEEFYSRILFLNASTLATAFILLNSISKRFPNGLGNDSDQVGRNLMDHHKGLNAHARVPGFQNSYYFGRRPASIYIPRFKNVQEQDSDFLRGYIIQGGAYRSSKHPEMGLGANFKNELSELGDWYINLQAYGECLPYPENRVKLNFNKEDPWGRPIMEFDCEFKENEKKMHANAGIMAEEMLRISGFKDIHIENILSYPGNANHEMGTARMGRDPRNSVLNGFNQMHAVKNLFITDGSCMPSSASLNPSLTFMALTARACDYAIKELKSGRLE